MSTAHDTQIHAGDIYASITTDQLVAALTSITDQITPDAFRASITTTQAGGYTTIHATEDMLEAVGAAGRVISDELDIEYPCMWDEDYEVIAG